jgi:predicted TIM-barrel fold metal-dependent hydrolase
LESIDCHLHVIDPERFPFADGPGYRPLAHERGSHEQLIETLNAHGVRHGLLVQPGCYGHNNAALLDAIATSHGKLKGIAAVDVEATEAELHSLKDRGIIGIRLNLLDYDKRVLSDPRLKNLLAKVRTLDWWVEVHASGQLLLDALTLCREAEVNTLVEHWGRPTVAAGTEQHHFQELLRFGREGRAVVKLSAPYRVSASPPPYHDLDPFAESLLAAFSPQRCIWGSDWPFINTSRPPDYETVKAAIGRWLSGDELQQVLWTTPARLFGF